MILSDKYIKENKTLLLEGELRCKELKKYLENQNLPNRVWISEDASNLVAKIEFDQNTNQMVGIVLPVDSTTGMPITFSYLARNANEIEKNMKKSMSTLVYVVVAQPLAKNVPPFILQVFGTDNKFKAKNVLHRWQHTKNELKKYLSFPLNIKYPRRFIRRSL